MEKTNYSLYAYIVSIMPKVEKKNNQINPTKEFLSKSGNINPNNFINWAYELSNSIEENIKKADPHDSVVEFANDLLKKLKKLKKSCFKWKSVLIDDDFRIMNDSSQLMDDWGNSIELLDEITRNLKEFINDNRYLAWQLEDKSIIFNGSK